MKFRAKIIWIAMEFETEVEISAKDATHALRQIQRIRLRKGEVTFRLPNQKKEYLSAIDIPPSHWKLGQASCLSPYIRELKPTRNKLPRKRK